MTRGEGAACRSPLVGLLLLLTACGDGDGWTRREGDCDDRDEDVRPSAPEICANGIDDDCDGLVDGEDDDGRDSVKGWEDADGDGYAGTELGWMCDAPPFTEATDCDDADPAISPAAAEVCGDGLDNDCDGGTRECEGIGVAEDISGADARYYSVTPYALYGDVSVEGGCGDLDGDGRIDVAALLSLADLGSEYDYGDEVGTWITLAFFDGSARGSLRAEDAWARPLEDAKLDEGAWSDGDLDCVGDLDGDSRSELAFSTQGVAGFPAGVYLLAPPARGDTAVEVRATWRREPATEWSLDVEPAGDIDGDGVAELFLGAPSDADPRLAFLLPGNVTGEHTTAEALLTLGDDQDFADSACVGEDADGDGIPDLAVGIDHEIWVYSGALRGDVARRDADILLRNVGGSSFARDLAWLADPEVGTARLVVYDGAPRTRGPRGLGLFDLSTGEGVLTATVTGEGDLEPFGGSAVGDLDGDGVGELAVQVPDGIRLLPPPREGSADLADARMGFAGWAYDARDAGDVDQDGDDDLLVHFVSDAYEGYAGLWLGGPPQ